MATVKVSQLTEKTAPHKDDLLVISDMENNISKKVKYGTIRPYKVYVALLTQAGTDAPVATVLENTLGGTVVWTRSAAGSYLGTLANAFTANKTFLFPPTAYSSADFNDWQLLLVRNNANAVLVTTSTAGGTTGADDILSEVPIEIRVYN